jgi:hypothetical protein
MIFVRHLLAAVALLALAACINQYTLAGPGPVASVGGLSLAPTIAWNRQSPSELVVSSAAPLEFWTQDGSTLQLMLVFGGVPDGQGLFRKYHDKSDFPAFRATMTASEIMELVEATLGKMSGSTLIQARDLKPARLGGLDGFQFAYSFTGKDEIDRDGIASGVVKDGKLYLLLYSGAKLHHFGKYRPEVERMFGSARFG